MRRASRIGMVAAALLLGVPFLRPLWHIGLIAPQYPEGLGMYIWINQITGQKPQDLNSINALNHYIGMKEIIPESIPELLLMPYLVGALLALALVTALAGKRPLLLRGPGCSCCCRWPGWPTSGGGAMTMATTSIPRPRSGFPAWSAATLPN